jgi:cysteine-rich repeat protein
VLHERRRRILLTTYGTDCGNGRLDSTESCDDGNRVSDDGCDDLCHLERHWFCPFLGRPCVRLCGNGTVDSDENCDDGNRISGDGCSADCLKIEEGWHCRVPGKACSPVCGDGMIVGTETCDDGNTQGRDGCSRVCQIEGYICKSPEGKFCQPSACAEVDGGTAPCNLVLPTVPICGDGIVSGDEECDDGNDPNRQPHNEDGAYGGCTTQCKLGPYCGDGVVSGPEICDDGEANLPTYGRPGCSFACQKARYCGDHIIDEVWGERCEPPYPESWSCTPQCMVFLP